MADRRTGGNQRDLTTKTAVELRSAVKHIVTGPVHVQERRARKEYSSVWRWLMENWCQYERCLTVDNGPALAYSSDDGSVVHISEFRREISGVEVPPMNRRPLLILSTNVTFIRFIYQKSLCWSNMGVLALVLISFHSLFPLQQNVVWPSSCIFTA